LIFKADDNNVSCYIGSADTENAQIENEIDIRKFTNTKTTKNSELNAEMANYDNALIAFWDGKSKGTKNMIDLATQAGLKIEICYY
jgi:DNA-binding phage protein